MIDIIDQLGHELTRHDEVTTAAAVGDRGVPAGAMLGGPALTASAAC